MFFPRGKPLHENLATSYVLVDALIGDLCEGGFSGVVEIVLGEADGHVIIERGRVAAALLKKTQSNESPTSIEELVRRARAERGLVSIYGYSTEVAAAIARRADASPLYTQLSTDFADLGKMLSKLARERDREWLIEVMTRSGSQALIYLRETDCLVVTSDGEIETADRSDLSGSRALDELLAECDQMGGTFDVFFRREEPARLHKSEPSTDERVAPAAERESPPAQNTVSQYTASQYKVSQAAASQSRPVTTDHITTDHAIENSEPDLQRVVPAATVSPEPVYIEEARPVDQRWEEDEQSDARAVEESQITEPRAETEAHVPEAHVPEAHGPDAGNRGGTAHLFASARVAEAAGEAEMIEVKRLMGEIARTVEDAIRAVSQQSNFAMHLRAGQLRVADRYPFLDPFGNEFEYLAGEIAFVGRVKPAEFINGLTEALRLALASAVQSSNQPARLRAIATEDLQLLRQRYRSEFEEFGLDQSVERITE